MKKSLSILAAVLLFAQGASAMSYSKAREQALFLADKMAYELGLSDDQYNAVYEINLDYFMCIDGQGDILGTYWERRNTDLGYVLTVAQYALYKAASYFYQPVSYSAGSFVYAIYEKYTKKRYYNEAPAVYETYQGGNRFYTESPYKGRSYGGETKTTSSTTSAKTSSTTSAKSDAAKQDSKQDNNQSSGSTSRGTVSSTNRTSSSSSSSSTSSKNQQGTESGSMSRSEAVSRGKENTSGSNSGGKR